MKRISGPTALIQMLVEEHRHIKTGLSLLDAMRKRIADRRTIPFGDIATLVRFFREYADKIHHRSEEELLFPAVEQTSDRQLKYMLGKLVTQHLMGRLFVGAMKDALINARAHRRGWRSSFLNNAQALHTLLTIHICDEDHLFFPLAERVLMRRNTGAEFTLVQRPAGKERWEERIDWLYQKYCPATPHLCIGGSLTICHDGGRRKRIR